MRKSIIATVVALFSAANLCLAGGGKVVVSANSFVGRGACAPMQTYCPPVIRPLPYYGGPQSTSFYSWGPSVVAYTTQPSTTFTTVSRSSLETTPVYSVPPPVFPTAAVTVYPNGNFGWKR